MNVCTRCGCDIPCLICGEENWEPVKTNPAKDGQYICYNKIWGIEICQYRESRGWDNIGLCDDFPTHWAELPKEPRE